LKDELIRKTSGFKALEVEELDSSWNLLGIPYRKQTGKEIIRKKGGPWASVAFKFQELDLSTNEWSQRMMLAFFKKMNGFFTRYSYFNIRNKEEAKHICDLLKEWWDL